MKTQSLEDQDVLHDGYSASREVQRGHKDSNIPWSYDIKFWCTMKIFCTHTIKNSQAPKVTKESTPKVPQCDSVCEDSRR